MIKHLLNQSGIQKYIGLGTQNVRIGQGKVLKVGSKSKSHNRDKFWRAILRFQGLKSMKMVQFWHSGYLNQCDFTCLIDLDGVWKCRSTGSGSKLGSKSKSHNHDKLRKMRFRFLDLKSMKMVQFWYSGYLIQCIFSCLIIWNGVWALWGTGKDRKLRSK